MSASLKFTLGWAIVLLLGAATVYEARLVAGQREQLGALQKRHVILAGELEKVHRQNESDAATLIGLQREIAAAQSTAATRASSPTVIETQAWLAKLATAKRLFAEHPEFGVPELQLLDLRAWLGAIKDLSFDTEQQTRKSLASIRDAAKKAFTQQLAFALQKFLETSDNALPPSVLTLAPYFNPLMDVAILHRYKMNLAGNLAERGDSHDPVILETTPVDEDYDARHGVNVGRMADGPGWGVVRGSFGGLGPAAWIDDYQDRLKRARADFTRDHPGTTSSDLAQLVPYLNPPLSPTVLEKLLKAERDRSR